MTTEESIMEDADGAEVYPESKTLNFGEVGIYSLWQWVEIMDGKEGHEHVRAWDVESVKSAYEDWWRKRRYGN